MFITVEILTWQNRLASVEIADSQEELVKLSLVTLKVYIKVLLVQ